MEWHETWIWCKLFNSTIDQSFLRDINSWFVGEKQIVSISVYVNDISSTWFEPKVGDDDAPKWANEYVIIHSCHNIRMATIEFFPSSSTSTVCRNVHKPTYLGWGEKVEKIIFLVLVTYPNISPVSKISHTLFAFHTFTIQRGNRLNFI